MTSTPSPSSERIRLTITVTPEVHAAFTKLADASGMSLGRAMGEWLQDTLEAVEFTAQKVQQARGAPKLVMREMHAYALGLADEMGSLLESVRQKGPAAGVSSAPAKRAPGIHQAVLGKLEALPGGVGSPRPVIRGGKSPSKGGSTGRPVKHYSALNPITGKRVLLQEGQFFDKAGVVKSKGRS
jgi:hypothetical protein